jgi:hypothetical protein
METRRETGGFFFLNTEIPVLAISYIRFHT